MKKVLKIIGILFLVVIIVVIAGGLYINFSEIPSYSVEKIDYQVVSNQESIDRGQKLAMMLCAGCHKDPETGRLSGTRMLEVPPEFGEIYSPNITQDKTHGIGSWTDGEIVYLLRTGIKRDGKYAPPYMAKLTNMADEDINAIISFLRSDNRMVAADPTPTTPSKPGFLTKLLCKVAWKPFPMPTEKIELPDTTQTLALGKYLAINLECFSCHSADFKTNDYLNPELSKGYFAGGNKPLDQEGRVMLTPNLTPDKETGIGDWSEEEFINAVKYGQLKGQTALLYPMQPYSSLTDTEVSAIYHYLKTIPSISNNVERSVYN